MLTLGILYTIGVTDTQEYTCLYEFVRNSWTSLLENTFTENLAVTV